MNSKTTEPDWTDSKTSNLEPWKNPLLPLCERLLIADGAVAFQRAVIANLRERIAKLESRLDSDN